MLYLEFKSLIVYFVCFFIRLIIVWGGYLVLDLLMVRCLKGFGCFWDGLEKW